MKVKYNNYSKGYSYQCQGKWIQTVSQRLPTNVPTGLGDAVRSVSQDNRYSTNKNVGLIRHVLLAVVV